MLAEINGKHDTIKKAILNGGNVNIVNNCKYTPLHSAVERGNIVNVNTLLKHNADITMVTDTGKTVLHLAAIYNNHVLLQRLISQAVDMNLIQRIVNMYDSNGDYYTYNCYQKQKYTHSETAVGKSCKYL